MQHATYAQIQFESESLNNTMSDKNKIKLIKRK